jgi:hypothetical protein
MIYLPQVCLAVPLLLTGATQSEVPALERADLSSFRYEASKLEVGRLYLYEHSNIDGSHATRVSLYIAADDRLESLKWAPGSPQTTLVVAQMNWETMSVAGFRMFSIAADGTRSPRGELLSSPDGRRLIAKLGASEFSCSIDSVPWHSYDFDFASLNVSMRFLVDPEAPTRVTVIDPHGGLTGPELRVKGPVELAFIADEVRNGIECRKYFLDGPGIEDRGGFLWTSRTPERHFVDFEFDLPDEASLQSGKLKLLDVTNLTAAQWEQFMKTKTTPVANDANGDTGDASDDQSK